MTMFSAILSSLTPTQSDSTKKDDLHASSILLEMRSVIFLSGSSFTGFCVDRGVTWTAYIHRNSFSHSSYTLYIFEKGVITHTHTPLSDVLYCSAVQY